MLGGEQSSWRLLNNWGEDGGSQAGFARLRTPMPHFFEKLQIMAIGQDLEKCKGNYSEFTVLEIKRSLQRVPSQRIRGATIMIITGK